MGASQHASKPGYSRREHPGSGADADVARLACVLDVLFIQNMSYAVP